MNEHKSEYVFPCQSGFSRPVRLSEATRRFAFESLSHKYGLDTRATPAVPLDGIENFDGLSFLEKYDAAIREIARCAPIRICDGELISGAATLGLAIDHVVPATRDGRAFVGSISHVTLDFGSVVRDGTNAIRERANASLARFRGTDREPFIKSCLHCLDAMDVWKARYIEALRERGGYEKNAANLSRVPNEGASSFHEAVQSLWFTFAFTRLCGNWPGIGRIDKILGPYLRRDLDSGAITLEEAREILAHFFIKGCEWVCGGNYGSGDAQHYQNIVLGGIDEDGQDVTSEVTYLVLDIIEETGIGDFPTSIRVGASTDEKLLRRAAEVVRLGGGVIAFYGEDTVLKALTDFGYDLREARSFANDGCWEVQIPGKTYFAYRPFDSLQILQKKTLREYAADVSFDSFETLYAAFAADLRAAVDELGDSYVPCFDGVRENGKPKRKPEAPCTVPSLFEEGCVESGYSYLECGPVYNVISPHIGGLADTVNSLYAIKKLVFDDEKATFAELMTALRADWEGYETLRLTAANSYSYYGNDNEEVDAIWSRLLYDFSSFCFAQDGKHGYRMPGGVSTFGRQLEWSHARLATPYGRRANEVLAANASPTPGTDREGATAIIRSYCRADLTRLTTGAALDVKLFPSSVEGDEGIDALVSLVRGFCALGGFFMQPDVLDAAALRAAQKHPEDYQTLSVRVSGWNARFVTLDREWQDMVIDQYERHS